MAIPTYVGAEGNPTYSEDEDMVSLAPRRLTFSSEEDMMDDAVAEDIVDTVSGDDDDEEDDLVGQMDLSQQARSQTQSFQLRRNPIRITKSERCVSLNAVIDKNGDMFGRPYLDVSDVIAKI